MVGGQGNVGRMARGRAGGDLPESDRVRKRYLTDATGLEAQRPQRAPILGSRIHCRAILRRNRGGCGRLRGGCALFDLCFLDGRRPLHRRLIHNSVLRLGFLRHHRCRHGRCLEPRGPGVHGRRCLRSCAPVARVFRVSPVPGKGRVLVRRQRRGGPGGETTRGKVGGGDVENHGESGSNAPHAAGVPGSEGARMSRVVASRLRGGPHRAQRYTVPLLPKRRRLQNRRAEDGTTGMDGGARQSEWQRASPSTSNCLVRFFWVGNLLCPSLRKKRLSKI